MCRNSQLDSQARRCIADEILGHTGLNVQDSRLRPQALHGGNVIKSAGQSAQKRDCKAANQMYVRPHSRVGVCTPLLHLCTALRRKTLVICPSPRQRLSRLDRGGLPQVYLWSVTAPFSHLLLPWHCLGIRSEASTQTRELSGRMDSLKLRSYVAGDGF